MPKVTVLMPVYNAAAYIKEAIDSILNQTFDDFEFLIFNDGSTDSSADIVQSYNDERIKFYDYHQNQGYVRHLNHGIDIAKGEYIARMDADDISLPRRLEKQVSFMDTNPKVGVCGTWYKTIGSSNEIKNPTDNDSIRLALLDYCAIGHPTVILRTSLLQEFSLFYDVSFLPAEDYCLWIVLSRYCELANLSEFLLDYRIHQGQISNYRRQDQAEKSQNLRKQQVEFLLGRLLTSTELNYYYLIFREIRHLSYDVNIEDILKWIDTLRNSNKDKCIYEPQIFNKWLLDALVRILNERENEILNQFRSELHQSQIKLQEAQRIVSAIETSKFWKLRKLWFAGKQFFGV